MGLRFRQSFTLFPGVRLNLGKRGMSASFGVPGATLNLSGRGVRGTVGLPSTGLSYSAIIPSGSPAEDIKAPPVWRVPVRDKEPETSHVPEGYVRPPGMREIGSAAVERLTSEGLLELRALITDARRQRKEVEQDLNEARGEFRARKAELERKAASLFRFMFKKRIAALEELVPTLEQEVDRLESWQLATSVKVEFEADDTAQRAYAALIRSYDALRQCAVAWDVTSDRETNRAAERTAASRNVERRKVKLDYSQSDLIDFGGKALRFANANGEDILLYPGLILMERADGAFALLDVRDVGINYSDARFIETETAPPDAKLVGHTWLKVNKDGSPDRRFNDNYQIPIYLYGELRFVSATGLTEEYQFSNAVVAEGFAQAFLEYQEALRRSVSS